MWRYSKNVALAIAVSASLVGCANNDKIFSGGQGSLPDRNEVPIAANFSTSKLLKLQSAEHWRRVANDSADSLIKSLQSGGTCIPKNGCTTLYLRRNCETTGCFPQRCDTAFNRVFFNEFLTALVRLGYQVSSLPTANAVVVDIDTQVVGFSAKRPQYRYAGEAVEIGEGVWALRDTASLIDKHGNPALRTAEPDTNWYRTEFAAGPTPKNELVITVSAMSQEKVYVARNTRVYYTSDSDRDHYSCPAESQPAVRAQVPPAAETRTWSIPVTGECAPPRCIQESDRRR